VSQTTHYTVVPPVPTDTHDPTITVASPIEGAEVVLGSGLTAQYLCTDADSGVQSCNGSVDNGAPLDTTTVGDQMFVVTAVDNAGNTSSTTVNYRVVWPQVTLESVPDEVSSDTTPTFEFGSLQGMRFQCALSPGS